MKNKHVLAAAGLVVALAMGSLVWAAIKADRSGRLPASKATAIGGLAWRRQPTVPGSLTLRGTVHDIGAATSGTLRVRIGDDVVTSTVTLPDYVVEVAGARADDMVTIWVEGAGFRHVSLAGSFAKLTRMAGADHVLTMDESLGRLRLSAFDTSLTHFVLRVLGHAPATDGAHEQAMRSVQWRDLAIANSALKALARQDVALPAGYDDGLSLLQDQQAFTAFATQNRALLDRQEYMADAASVAFPTDDLGDRVILLDAVRRDQGAMVYPLAQVVEKTPDGYLVNTSSSRTDASFVSERLPSGDVRLHPNSIIETSTYYGPEFGWEHRRLGLETYRRMFVGETTSLWMVVKEEFITYTGSTAPPSHWSVSSRFWTVSSPDMSPRLDRSLPRQQVALPVFCSGFFEPLDFTYAVPCEVAVHSFGVGGTGQTSGTGSKIDGHMQPVTPSGGEHFSWSFDNRRSLRLAFADVQVAYWPLGFGDAATMGLVYVATVEHPEGDMTLAGYAPMLRPGASETPSGMSVTGDWRYATFSYLLPYVQRPGTYANSIFSRYADGTMLRTAALELPANPRYFRSNWQLLAGRLYSTSFYSDAETPPRTFGHSSCEQAYAEGATMCGIESVRYFQPMSKMGNRIYGIEDVYTNVGHSPLPISDPEQLVRQSRFTFYEKL